LKIDIKIFKYILLIFTVTLLSIFYTFYFFDFIIISDWFLYKVFFVPYFNFLQYNLYQSIFNFLLLIFIFFLCWYFFGKVSNYSKKFLNSLLYFGPIYIHYLLFSIFGISLLVLFFRNEHLQKFIFFNGDYFLIFYIYALLLMIYYINNRSNVVSLNNFTSNNIVSPSDFLNPIYSPENDLLNYSEKSLGVVDAILNYEKIFPTKLILISGRWGIGKTSFMNLIDYNLKMKANEFKVAKGIKTSYFNVSQFSEIEKLYIHFYNDILNIIEEEVFLPLIKKKVFGFSVASLFSKNVDYSKLFGRFFTNDMFDYIKILSSWIEALNLKIVIYLDDIDRLDPKNEMDYVFKLFRLLKPNLKNVIVIVSSDSKIIEEYSTKFNVNYDV